MKDLDAWVRKEIKAMEKMDAKIDKQLDKLEAIVGIKKSKKKPAKKKVTKAKKVEFNNEFGSFGIYKS